MSLPDPPRYANRQSGPAEKSSFGDARSAKVVDLWNGSEAKITWRE